MDLFARALSRQEIAQARLARAQWRHECMTNLLADTDLLSGVIERHMSCIEARLDATGSTDPVPFDPSDAVVMMVGLESDSLRVCRELFGPVVGEYLHCAIWVKV